MKISHWVSAPAWAFSTFPEGQPVTLTCYTHGFMPRLVAVFATSMSTYVNDDIPKQEATLYTFQWKRYFWKLLCDLETE